MRWMAMAKIAGISAAAAGQQQPRAHTETSFDLVVHAAYTDTAALFGPQGERVWAGRHWDPQFVFPQPGRDEQGAVFTMQHGPLQAVWVIAQHDLEARHFQYVYVFGGLMACTVDVRFDVIDPATTKVHVTYARTAITPEADEHVAAMTEGDRKAGADWQASIDRYLASRKTP